LKGTHLTYWGNIAEGYTTLLAGMKLSWKHLWKVWIGKKYSKNIQSDNYFDNQEGAITVQYPNEIIPVPDHGRYRLDNVMEDCIVCDKCVKICPVNCIEIDPIRSASEIRKTSDGSSVRLYAAKFDIDMAKCCYCGLCTTVCPTECLTMTKTYDYSEYSVDKLLYHYSDLSPKEATEKQEEFDLIQAVKKAKREQEATERATAKPTIKPAGEIKPKILIKKPSTNANTNVKTVAKPKIKILGVKKPNTIIKPKIPTQKKESNDTNTVKPVIKPKIVIPTKKTATLKPKIAPKPKKDE